MGRLWVSPSPLGCVCAAGSQTAKAHFTLRGTLACYLLVAISDTTAIEIVYREFNLNLVAREDLDVVHTHLAGNMGKDGVTVFKLYLKHSVWKSLEYGALQFNCIFFSQGSGAMLTGWQSVGGKWYYLNGSGAMETGWYKVGSNWYYSNPSGVMRYSTWIGDYYLLGDGRMATNRWVGGYYVGADGKWVR